LAAESRGRRGPSPAGLEGSGLSVVVGRARARRRRVPVLGLRSVEDVSCAPVRRLDRGGNGRGRWRPPSRVDWDPRLSESVQARSLDGPERQDDNAARGLRSKPPARSWSAGEGKGGRPAPRVEVGTEQYVAKKVLVIANGGDGCDPHRSQALDQGPTTGPTGRAGCPGRRGAPESLAILGGGAIGVELGQAFARVGPPKGHGLIEGGARLPGPWKSPRRGVGAQASPRGGRDHP